MSLYNLINGVNPITFFVLPMLGLHPDSIPRFRNVFLSDEDHPEYDNFIHVYTRVGGGNRYEGYGEEVLESHDQFVTTWDDEFDSTYGTYVFNVPEKWKSDFEAIREGKLYDVTKEYVEQMKLIFPKLSEKFDTLFNEMKESK